MGIPYLYIMWVAYDVYRNNLLPPTGYRRECKSCELAPAIISEISNIVVGAVSLYYFKIVFIVMVVWMPFLIVFVALRGVVNHWVIWTAGALAHSQTLISPLLACQKHDIRVAVLEFWLCYQEQPDDSKGGRNSIRRGRTRISGIVAAGVCRGSFPQQREDFAFDGETASMHTVASEHMNVVALPEAMPQEEKDEDELRERAQNEDI